MGMYNGDGSLDYYHSSCYPYYSEDARINEIACVHHPLDSLVKRTIPSTVYNSRSPLCHSRTPLCNSRKSGNLSPSVIAREQRDRSNPKHNHRTGFPTT